MPLGKISLIFIIMHIDFSKIRQAIEIIMKITGALIV
jgi:hypothetical protein